MTADEYRGVTGKYPAGYQVPYTPGYNPTPKSEPGTGGDPLSVIDLNDISTLPENARRSQVNGLIKTFYQGDASARANALNYVTANVDKFTDDELSNIASAINYSQPKTQYGGYNR